MNREKEMLKNTIVLGIGRFLPMAISVMTLPILTALLAKAEYGSYDLITTLVLLLIPISTLQIQSAAFRFLIDCREDKHRASVIVSTILTAAVPMILIVSAATVLFLTNLSSVEKAAVVCYFFFDGFYSIVSQIARGFGKNKEYASSAILLSIITGGGLAFSLLALHTGLLGVISATAIANVCAAVYILWKTKLPEYYRIGFFSKIELKRMLSYSWPMVPNNLSNWILKLSDRLVITAFLGLEATAVYAVANKIPNLLSSAHTVIGMAWQENASIASSDRDADAYYGRMFLRIFYIVIGITAVLIGVTPIIFSVLIKGEYDDAYVQIPVLILAMFFYCMASVLGGIYVAQKKTVSVGITTTLAAVINLALDFALIRSLGITAGSLSTLAAYLFLYIYRQIDIQRFRRINLHVKEQVLCIIIVTGMLAVSIQRSVTLDIINISFGVLFAVMINRSIIRAVLLKIKNWSGSHEKI